MLYDLSKKIDKEHAVIRLNELIKKDAIIELTHKKKRSIQQNAYLHLILGWFGNHTGYTLEEVKQMYKHLNKDIYYYKVKDFQLIKSSKDIDKHNLTSTIDKFRDYSNKKVGLYLPAPNEQEFLQEIEIQLSRNKYV